MSTIIILNQDNYVINNDTIIKENNNNNNELTKIKYRDIYNYNESITIYKGFLDNIKVNDIVTYNNYLIGIVTKTYKHSSIVRLITSNESKVSVKINNSYGILKFNNKELIVDNIDTYQDINIGDLVYTSGFGLYNSDLYIGKVSKIITNDTLIENKILLEDTIDIKKIKYVSILRGIYD